jgi:hypothetical protein
MEGDDCNTLGTLEPEPLPPSPFLLLPPEVRLIIYQMLFANLRVKMHTPDHSTNQDVCAIMPVCQSCHAESVPEFYNSVIITLKHEAFLYVLRKRLEPHKMACIRQIAVGGFDMKSGNTIALHLCPSLEKLYLERRSRIDIVSTTVAKPFSDRDIRRILDNNHRHRIHACLNEL